MRQGGLDDDDLGWMTGGDKTPVRMLNAHGSRYGGNLRMGITNIQISWSGGNFGVTADWQQKFHQESQGIGKRDSKKERN